MRQDRAILHLPCAVLLQGLANDKACLLGPIYPAPGIDRGKVPRRAVASVGLMFHHTPLGGTSKQRIVLLRSDLRQMCQPLSGLMPVYFLSTISPVERTR